MPPPGSRDIIGTPKMFRTLLLAIQPVVLVLPLAATIGQELETIDPDKDRWELCSRVLARRNVLERLSAPW